MAEQRIKVLLVDDHELARAGLRRMLELEKDIQVIGEASSAEEAVEKVGDLSPDVVLMDIKMPTANGLDATRRLREGGLPGQVIILSLYEEYLAQAIEAGAGGYLLKNLKREELASAIRRVHRGEMVLAEGLLASPTLIEAALRRFQEVVRGRTKTEPQTSTQDTEMAQEMDSPPWPQNEKRHEEEVMPAAQEFSQPEVILAILPPIDVASLLVLSRRLREHHHVEVLEAGGSWTEGSWMKLLLRQPIALREMLAQMPEVAQVWEWEQEDKCPLPQGWELFAGDTIPSTRLCLLLKSAGDSESGTLVAAKETSNGVEHNG